MLKRFALLAALAAALRPCRLGRRDHGNYSKDFKNDFVGLLVLHGA
jgi:hypothetical protein